ncbi:MAG: ABC transporter permease [Candidatus Methylomirabilota bacterium]|jgi:putative spermidine/putrescine transport system permease protein
MSLRVGGSRRRDWGSGILTVFVVLVMLYLIAPMVTVVLASFTETDYIRFPPSGFTLQWYGAFLFGDQYWHSIGLSLFVAVAAIAGSGLIALPAAYGLVRYRFPGRDWINMAAMTPIIIPEMISAIALFQFLVGLGWRPSVPMLILGHVLLTVPFMLRSIVASLQGLDDRLEEAARGLGAKPLTAYFTITLPLIRTGIFAGALFVFVISMDLFLVSMFLSKANTLPVELWWALRYNSSPTLMALATLMIGMTVPTIVVVGKLVGLESIIGIGRA